MTWKEKRFQKKKFQSWQLAISVTDNCGENIEND